MLGRSSTLHRLPRAGLAAALVVALTPARAAAHANGFAVEGCSGCHHGGASPTVTLKASPPNPAPGATVTLDIAIAAVNGQAGGLYLLGDGRGTLVNLAGQGTRLVDKDRLVHSAPKAATSGAVHFQASWVAPKTAGGIVFKVWGLSANGDGTSDGDGEGFTELSFAYGCADTTYYADHDEDGYGSDADSVVDCAAPLNTSSKGGDCDDNNPAIHPGASELCNGRDDDCDGQVDEDLAVGPQYEDADGDGHGGLDGKVVMAKCPPSGYASTRDDCDDKDPTVYAGAPETCNYKDDDCDGRIDEGVRARCGVGMCAREAETCGDNASCTPGSPAPETCNGLDDDCDGQVDEGADLCGVSEACAQGLCAPAGEGGGSTGSAGDPGSRGGCHAGGCGVGASESAPRAGALVTLLGSLLALSRRRRRAG